MEQKQSLQQMVLGDLDSYVQKNETRSPTYGIHIFDVINQAVTEYSYVYIFDSFFRKNLYNRIDSSKDMHGFQAFKCIFNCHP